MPEELNYLPAGERTARAAPTAATTSRRRFAVIALTVVAGLAAATAWRARVSVIRAAEDAERKQVEDARRNAEQEAFRRKARASEERLRLELKRIKGEPLTDVERAALRLLDEEVARRKLSGDPP